MSFKTDPIYTWTFQSSKPRAGGETINYEVRLNDTGILSCNCPGWVFSKGTKACKHTRDPKVLSVYKKVYKAWKNEEKPVVYNPETVISKDSGDTLVSEWKGPKFSRLLEI